MANAWKFCWETMELKVNMRLALFDRSVYTNDQAEAFSCFIYVKDVIERQATLDGTSSSQKKKVYKYCKKITAGMLKKFMKKGWLPMPKDEVKSATPDSILNYICVELEKLRVIKDEELKGLEAEIEENEIKLQNSDITLREQEAILATLNELKRAAQNTLRDLAKIEICLIQNEINIMTSELDCGRKTKDMTVKRQQELESEIEKLEKEIESLRKI